MPDNKRMFIEPIPIPPHPYDSDPNWQSKGACKGKTALFFPPRGTPGSKIREAKAICKTCPIRQQCLDYALWHGDKHGIWGGKTDKERRQIRLTMPNRPDHRRRVSIKWVDNDIYDNRQI